MLILLPVLLFLLIVGIVSYFGYRHYVRPTRMLDQLASSTSQTTSGPLLARTPKREFSLARLLEPIGNLLPVSSQDAGVAKQDLFAAGFRTSSAVAVYYGSKILLTIVFVLGSLVLRQRLQNPLLRLMLPVSGGGIGYFL